MSCGSVHFKRIKDTISFFKGGLSSSLVYVINMVFNCQHDGASNYSAIKITLILMLTVDKYKIELNFEPAYSLWK